MTEETVYTWEYKEGAEYWSNSTYQTREEAIEAGREQAKLDGEDVFFLGICEWCAIPEIYISDIFDILNERYYDTNDMSSEYELYNIQGRGKESEDAKELEKNIRELIKDFTAKQIEKFGGRCFKIIGTEKIEV